MIRWFCCFLFSFCALAAPRNLEVWFLSVAKISELQDFIKDPPLIFGPLNAKLECHVMGDFCFDPQYGLYKKDDGGNEVDANTVPSEHEKYIPAAKSVDRELITCDPTNMFDMFCGKSRKESSSTVTKLDLWIDTSSSMREFDFPDKTGGCHRKQLLMALDGKCPFNQKVNVMMFDTSIKQAGDMDSLCVNQGLNDYKRLMDWIERSESKSLVVITDIYELHSEFADFIESKHGKLRGDKDPLTAQKMVELAKSLSQLCQ